MHANHGPSYVRVLAVVGASHLKRGVVHGEYDTVLGIFICIRSPVHGTPTTLADDGVTVDVFSLSREGVDSAAASMAGTVV